MSLWKRISSHADCEQRMAAFYDEKGLFDLRLCLAPWIEDRIMSEHITPNSTEQFERIALKFNEDLQQKLLSTRTATDQALKYRVVELCALIQRIPALELYTHLRSGLQKELQLATEKSVAATGGQSMPLYPYNMNNPAPMATAGFMDDASQLLDNSAVGAVGAVVGAGAPPITPMGVVGHNPPSTLGVMGVVKMELYDLNQQILQSYNDFCNIANPLKIMMNTYEFVIQSTGDRKDQYLQSLRDQKTEIVCHLHRSFACYDTLQDMAVTELKNWRRQQAQAGNGASFNEQMLDDIQRCFGLLETFVCHLLEAVKQVRLMEENQELKQFMEQVQIAQKNLVCSAFIVDKQPPQVMKTNTRFASSVRWLIGSQLGIHNNPPTVECIIMSEQQAQRFVTRGSHMDGVNNSVSNQSSGEIQNCSSTMEYQQNQIFSASFRNMQLKKIKRAEKKGTESVMDEKFALFFYTTTTVDSYQIRVWTLSLPVVVIVHGNQEPQSWATITWDNAFAEIVRDPFVVTDRVTWCQLSLALNIKFGSSTQRPLTTENLDFLFEKLQRDNISGERNECISWNQFCKEPLPERAFTFWEWFYAIMKLTKDHLLGMWKAGRITGFISKAKAQDNLMRAITGIGTFLVRFSDSELGAVSIAYVDEYGAVVMLKPWTSKDFHIINLADRIRDLDLRYLHPTDINVAPLERDTAFGEFYTPRTEPAPRTDGYVPSMIRVQVRSSGGDNGSIAGTPHHPMQSPPQDAMNMGNSPLTFGNSGIDASPSMMDDSDSDDSQVANEIQILVESVQPGDPILNEISCTIMKELRDRDTQCTSPASSYTTVPSPMNWIVPS